MSTAHKRLGVVLAAGCVLSFLVHPAPLLAQDASGGLGGRKDTVGFTVGKYHALLIAAQRYKDPAIPRLQWPIVDAENLRDVLVKRYRFDNVELLRDPTRTQILDALQQLDSLGPSDNLLIFFAGHGKWVDGTDVSYWLPVEASPTARSSWISDADIRSLVKSIRTQHTLLIADACFAGAALVRRVDDVPPGVAALYAKPSRKAMTSGAKEVVPDKSVFVEYLVKNLEANNSKYLSAFDLFANVRTAVLHNSVETPQFAALQGAGDQGGDFLFPLKGAGDTTRTNIIDGGPSKDSTRSAPLSLREQVAAKIQTFVQMINSKQIGTLMEFYSDDGKPADWKEKLTRLIREDLIKATLARTPRISLTESSATSEVDVQVLYKDPVVRGNVSKTLRFLVRHARLDDDWDLRRFSLIAKPPM